MSDAMNPAAGTAPLSRQEELTRLAVKSFEEGKITVEEARALLASADEEKRTFDPNAELAEEGGPEDEFEDQVLNPGTGVGSYVSMLDHYEKPKLPPEEAIPDLFEKMKPYRKFLTAILEACREEATTEAVDAAVLPEYEFCGCVYSPISLRKMLVEAGALAYIEPVVEEGQAEAEAAEDAEAPAVPVAEEALEPESEPEAEPAAEPAVDPVAEPKSEAPAFEDEDEDIDERPSMTVEDEASTKEAEEEIVRGSIYDQEGYLVIEDEPEGTWKITEEGLAYLESIDPERQFSEELQKHANVDDVFYSVLEYCAEQPRNITDIVKHFEDDPRLGPETFYASFVVDRLEEIGALVWKRNWMPTDLGLKLLAERKAI